MKMNSPMSVCFLCVFSSTPHAPPGSEYSLQVSLSLGLILSLDWGQHAHLGDKQTDNIGKERQQERCHRLGNTGEHVTRADMREGTWMSPSRIMGELRNSWLSEVSPFFRVTQPMSELHSPMSIFMNSTRPLDK